MELRAIECMMCSDQVNSTELYWTPDTRVPGFILDRVCTPGIYTYIKPIYIYIYIYILNLYIYIYIYIYIHI